MSTAWSEKAGRVEYKTDKYSWSQGVDDVVVNIPIPPNTTSKMIDYAIKTDRLKLGIKGQPPIFDGPLFGNVVPAECGWTLEDRKLVCLVMQKAIKHQTWTSVIKGADEVDVVTKDAMEKKMMLEKFQGEYAGFDFSGAEFTGQVPQDPSNFMKFD